MNAAPLQDAIRTSPDFVLAPDTLAKLIGAGEFRNLLVSHRRMVRFDRREERLRGLRDLDTGEVFLTDERRLIEVR